MVNGTLLIVDDDEKVLVFLKVFLRQHFAKIHAHKNPQEALACLQNEVIDVFILDMNYSRGASTGSEGIDLLNTIRRIDPQSVILFIVEWGNAELVNNAIKAGANNFIQKPWNDRKMLATINSAMDLSKSRQLVERLREQQRNFYIEQQKNYQMPHGRSGVMADVMNVVEELAGTDTNVILHGEKGTGKEMIARKIHLGSERKTSVFLKVDLEDLTESSIESELFGHVKGTLADSPMDKPGCFEIASRGTIFINEIDKLPGSLQIKLLNVLDNNEIFAVGSNLSADIDTRIISATNLSPEKMVLDKSFLKDLMDRLNTVCIYLPPLRSRMEDLPVLVEFFLSKLGEKYRKNISMSKGALKKLEKHHWPGNIRELKNSLEKAVILSEQSTLSERDFLFKSRLMPAEGIALLDLKQNEKEIIKNAILLSGGNLSRASRQLGISRKTLYNKISKYGI